MKYTWKVLRDEGLITEEKYKRLTGRNPFTDEQKAGFIARQLVETGQGTKGVADLLTALLPDTKLVYSKAGNVSDFRKKYDIPKSRLINDFHHAHDAYLNIVVGNIYFTKFTSNPLNYIRKECSSKDNKYQYNLGNMYKWDVKRDGKTAWIAAKEGETGTIATVKKMLSRNTPTLTRLALELNSKKVLTKLYQELQEIADIVCQEKYIQVKSDLIAFMDELADNSSYALEFDLEFEISSLLKIFNMHLLNNAQGLLENIIEYIKAQSRICNIKNFFFINLKDYLNEKDIDMLYEFVRYEKVNLILIESHQSHVNLQEKRWILDMDRCIIEPDELTV